MAEYIEREEVCRKIREEPMPWGQRWDAAIEDFIRDIRKIPAADVRPEQHGEWQATKKHLWYKNKDGTPDIFAYSVGFCNGVECKKCHQHVCVHCTPDWDSDDEDNDCYYKHYVCSCCRHETMEKTAYCPNCGAKMDGEG